MKIKLTLLILCSLIASTVWASPFRTHYLCVPTLTPNQPNLEFKIRDRGTCAEGENYMQIDRRGNGIILILPAETPLSKEEQADLERYRKFFGGNKK